jgi:hypothetical protein
MLRREIEMLTVMGTPAQERDMEMLTFMGRDFEILIVKGNPKHGRIMGHL